MLPCISRNPLFSLMDKSRWVFYMFGSLKYTVSNTSMTARQNLYIESMPVDSLMHMNHQWDNYKLHKQACKYPLCTFGKKRSQVYLWHLACIGRMGHDSKLLQW
jgi:hypothetical protein